MPRFVCLTCNGEYSDVAGDGSDYYHACAPLSGPELEALGAERREAGSPPIERIEKRDESPVAEVARNERGRLERKKSRPRAEGRGRRKVVG